MRTRFSTLPAKLGIAAAALAVGVTAAPAAADAQQRGQHYGYDRAYAGRDYVNPDRLYRFNREVASIRHDIRQLRYDRLITNKEARKLRKKADRLQERIQRMSYRGVTRWEVREARDGVRNLRAAIRHEIRDGRHRYDRDRRGSYRQGDWDDDRRDRRRDRRDRWDD